MDSNKHPLEQFLKVLTLKCTCWSTQVFFVPDTMIGSDGKVVLQKEPHSERIVVEIIDLMLMGTLGNNDTD
jgi:hypothetical protein